MDDSITVISPHASPSDLFLASKSAEYSYGDLYFFADYLRNWLDHYAITQSSPLGIQAHLSDLTVFTIAACWMRNIPFFCFNPDEKQKASQKKFEPLQPALVVGDAANDQKIPQWITEVAEMDLSKILAQKHAGESVDFEANHYDEEQIFSYFFSSGTTGAPKIVPLKRRQMIVAARASAQNIKPATGECWLLCLPLHHVGGASLILRSLLYGSAIYRMNGFEASTVTLLLAADQRIAAASLVPTMLKRLLKRRSFTTHDEFQAILLGGAPVSHGLLQECSDRNIPVLSSFGMTETCAQIAANPVLQTKNFDAAGKIFEPNCIEIRGEKRQSLATGASGAIWLKGPQIFDGYPPGCGNDDALDSDGWFNTGDFGRLDERGQLYVEARRTDLIITGGENVSPFEVEAALEALDEIKEAAVFGVPDEQWGQKVVAAVVGESSTNLSEEVLLSALRRSLPSFKIPKQFIAVDELPHTHNGKIRRSELPALLE